MKGINKEIFRLALPSILANITVPLVGLVDVVIAGHIGTYLGQGDMAGAALLGGIAIGSMLFDILYWNFSFLRAGTSGMTAQAFGRGSMRECTDNLSRGVLLSLAIALFILLIQWPFAKGMMYIVSCSDEVRRLALQYFFIRIWAAPATLSLMAFRGWFIGMQDSFSSMIIDVIVLIVNALASFLFSYGIHIDAFGILGISIPAVSIDGMGYPGIAVGTVIAQYAGLLYAVLRVAGKYGHQCLKGYGLRDALHSFKGERIRQFTAVNADFFIHSLCLIFIYVGTTIISARYGDLLLASISIIMKLMLFFSYFTDGFAFAGEALTGRFVGAKDRAGIKQTVKWTFIWSGIISLAFVLINAVGSTPLLHLMTSDMSVIEISRQFIPWLIVMPIIGFPAFSWDGIYLGATASVPIRNSSIYAMLAFFAVWFCGIGIAGTLGLSTETYYNAAMHILLASYFAHLIIRDLYMSFKYFYAHDKVIRL